MSLSHTRFQRNKSSDNHVMTKNEKMAKLVYKLSMVGIVGIIGSSDPVAIRAHLVAIQTDLNIVMENPNLLDSLNLLLKIDKHHSPVGVWEGLIEEQT